MAHTWVPGWHAGDVEAIVAEACDAAWECLVVESTSSGPFSETTRAEISAAGATVIGPGRGEIYAALAMVDEIVRRRLGRRAPDQRPMLLLIGDGNHLPNDVLQRVAVLGRAADVHLAVDERARRRLPWQFHQNILGVYCASAVRCNVDRDGALPDVREGR